MQGSGRRVAGAIPRRVAREGFQDEGCGRGTPGEELQEQEFQERSCGSRDSRSRVAGAGFQEEFWRRGVAGAGFQEEFWSLGAKNFEFSLLGFFGQWKF